MSARTLITGGLGYVGGRLYQGLRSNASLDLCLGSRRIPAVMPQWARGLEVIPMDLSSDQSLDAACEGVNCVIHLAALNEIESAKDPQLALEVNAAGALRMLRAAQRARVERFIYLSTAHVYGSPLAGVIDERTVPRPVHPYAITHRAAEDFVLASHDRGGIVGIVLRLSNGFGAPADPAVNRWTLLANDLCKQAATTASLVLRSSGLQQRDFITLEDVAACVAHFISLPVEACGNGLFNLGGGRTMSVLAMAELVAARCEVVLGFRPAIERPAPAPEEMSTQGMLDYRIDKLRSTGFSPRGSFEAEIDATLRLCNDAFGRGS
ncbi:MAG: SDR family oxidoreductase [Deltaproteobacteria bacterium]|nr:SDR family oxidoreductase [Deltaproteobacteria bacterium]